MILALITALLASVVVLTLAIRLAARYGGKVVGELVYRKHKDAEFIVTTGEIPPGWQVEGDGSILAIEAVKEVDKLIAYFQSSPCVSDEDTRRVLLERLQNARSSWLKNASR
jgi:hypothetical protein